MQPRSVLVSNIFSKVDGSTCVFGMSGILLSPNWIMTSGSLLSPNFDKGTTDVIADFLIANQRQLENKFVALPSTVSETMKFKLQYNCNADSETKSSRTKQMTIFQADCSLRVMWSCRLLRWIFNDLLAPWSFDKVSKFDKKKAFLPIFLLLRVRTDARVDCDYAKEAETVLRDFYSKQLFVSEPTSGLEPCRGSTVEIESAPFGNIVFLDSVSRGIVSNNFGCLIMTDAKAVPGCEGAPLFLVSEPEGSRRICGLVIAVVSWCRGEWVDFTFAANLRTCLDDILGVSDEHLNNVKATKSSDNALLLPEILDKSVVVVKGNAGWGSGVVVDVPTGTILTCSHVIREASGDRVKIGLPDNEEAWARLVYKTRDGQPYDVAVLRLEQRNEKLKALPLAIDDPEKGRPVLAVGFPLLPGPLASCSRGVVSRLSDYILQTTCCVQGGASGGPIVDCQNGEMLGLIVSNAVASDATLYPRFNMAVPVKVLRRLLMEYVKTGDAGCLENFTCSDPTVLDTWNLFISQKSKM